MSMHAVGNSTPRSTAASVTVIFAAAALAVAPQIIWGDSCGHDFDFHLVSWFDALNAWRHGIPYPHWTESANFGAGEPRFVFYSPLTWMLGAALGAIIPWSLVPVALTSVILAGTGLATRAFARETLSESAASLAGCIAIFSGYPLFTAYERSAFAELAGGMWIPLVLLYGLRSSASSDPSSLLRRRLLSTATVPLAIAIAGAWLSNPTVGVMASYLLAALTIVVAIQARSIWPALRNAVGGVFGLGLSSIYLVPAARRERWVDIHQVTEDPGQTLENNWLFARHADPALASHDQVLHTVSMIAIGMIAVTLIALIVCALRKNLPGSRRWWLPLALIPIAVLLLQFPVSGPVWMLPELRFLQFPWRWLLVLEAPLAVFLVAAIWPDAWAKHSRALVAVGCGACFICITAGAGRFLYQACYPEDTVPAVVSALSAGKGYAGTSEYEPLGADTSLIPTNLPQACLTMSPGLKLGKLDANGVLTWDTSQGGCEATYSTASSSEPEHIRIAGLAPHSGFLIIRLLTFPAWRVTLNGAVVTSNPARPDGLMAVPVQAGAFNIAVDWTTISDVILGRWLSAISVFALTAIWLFKRN